MDAFNLLKADHRKVAELFNQLESATGKRKMSVFEQIKMELELHAHIEEKVFYPALEKPKETHDLTLEAYEEHDVVKKLLRELSRAKSPNEEWETKAKVLQENVEHHVEEEENELFPKADAVLSDEELDTLGERLETEKERKLGTASKKGSSKSAKGSSKSATKASATKQAAKRMRGSKKTASKRSSKSSKTAKRSGSKKSAKKR